MAHPTKRAPNVGASRAQARGVPCHPRTIPPRRGAQPVSTWSAWRPASAGCRHPMRAAAAARSAPCAAALGPASDAPRSGHTSGPTPSQSSPWPTRWPGAGSDRAAAACSSSAMGRNRPGKPWLPSLRLWVLTHPTVCRKEGSHISSLSNHFQKTSPCKAPSPPTHRARRAHRACALANGTSESLSEKSSWVV